MKNIIPFILTFLLVAKSFAQTDSINIKKPKITGCFATWNQDKYPIIKAPLDKLNEIAVCFAWPNNEGNLNTSELEGIDFIVKKCHAKNVKVILALGGATKSEAFPVLSASPKARKNFIDQTVKYCLEHKIDGINMDWEHWPNQDIVDEKVNKDIVQLFKELYTATQANNLWLAFDVYGSEYYGKHYPAELINYADEMVIMAYDGAGVWSGIGHHSDLNLFNSGYSYWLNKMGKENANKFTMGVPFYGISFDKNHTPGNSSTARVALYNDILMSHKEAYTNDTIQTKSEIIIHNGINTLSQKVDLIKERGNMGVLIWEISFDRGTREKSLTNFLREALDR